MKAQIYKALAAQDQSLANHFSNLMDEKDKQENRLQVIDPVIDTIQKILLNGKSASVNIQTIHSLVRNL